jgi:hypothetical protein
MNLLVATLPLILAQSDDSGGSGLGLGVLILLAMYFIPTIVGAIRKVPNIGSIAVVNFFLGWTFVGWVVALAMSVRSVPPRQP